MKLQIQSGVGMALSILSAMGVSVCLFSQPSLAQQGTINPLQDFNSQHNDSGTSLGIDQSTMYNLIHRAQMGTLDFNPNSVYLQQQDNIRDAAAEFRARQRQMFQQNPQFVNDDESSVGTQLNPQN